MKKLYNHFFPTPSYLAMDSCAIDISDQSIKYGELSINSRGLSLSRYGKEKIPQGVVVSGKIEKEDELVRILKNIKEKEKLHFIRVSLPEEQMYLFSLSVPKTSQENIRDMILLQIEEHIPLKAIDSIFDYDIIKEDSQNILVEVVAIASSTLESYLSVFSKAGLVPLTFEIEAQAIARAVIPYGDNSPVMIVDFGDARTGVSIASNGRVLLTTTLAIGGADLTNMIAKNFSLSFDEAEKMKHEYGIGAVSKVQDIFPAILNGISVLRDELNKQYLYWENHNSDKTKHEQIDHIILCGGESNLIGLSEYLQLSMKIKVENANVWINILKTEKSVPGMTFEESLSYATVLGLALGHFSYDFQPVINVLPEQEKKTLRHEYWMRFSTIILNLIALIGILAILLLLPSYYISKSEENLAESKLEVFNQENPELNTNNIDKIIKNINEKLETVDKAKAPYQISDKILGNILESRTDGITYSQILFSKKIVKKTAPVVDESIDKEGLAPEKKNETIELSIIEVRGQARDRDALRNFKTALDSNPNFAVIDLPISNFLEKADLVFNVSITLK